MKKATKILYILLAFGIGFSILQLFIGQGGSGLGNFIDSIHITSLIIFILSIIVLVATIRKKENRNALWIILAITFPLAVRIIAYQTGELLLSLQDTTTPKSYQISANIEANNYETEKSRLIDKIDSLISIGIRYDTAEVALSYFEGKQYNDDIERSWAIDLPQKLDYKQIFLDTLIWNPNNRDEMSGLLIAKAYNQYVNYPNGGMEYFGKGFVYNENNNERFRMLKYTLTGNQTYEDCSSRTRDMYLKRLGQKDDEYNINDKRFWTKNK